jgi:HAD superfamily hydrolase (TIGR01484 family)
MKLVFSDFDGTLTNNGKLGAVFFDLLDIIQKNNSELIIVSGRSVSWGHFLVTHFPLKHVIMEGGGVIVSKTVEGEIKEEYMVDGKTLGDLTQVTHEIQKNHPEVILSADSLGRRSDRAVEFAQMKDEDVKKFEKYLVTNKVNFSRSNVHINFWLGDISKANAIEYYLKAYAPHVGKEECIFYGDARNDESVFEYLDNTVGVSNIISVLDELEHKPRIVLEGKENAGAHGVYNHLKDIFDQSVDF